ncbi:MAG: 50S ribosomal protein L29 [Lachnospiraceae bacterium]|jgi:large subunit ribosomal protein L29|nr:50S ribosomal protein L29 [Lachnospiraceae bacterium]MBO6299597.1 50S ribosomal protein L29 [Lachnospiraceae bacterium]MBP3296583.1 50S ribosomal protein L29 [Lachnospiraceae bacterium]MBR3103467.1 50S ribosomal protein L29 [Lachnospiraceae bacterium]MBR6156238.1 50S ribosomal protein L29 [Lachnospiraceae bacterium]
MATKKTKKFTDELRNKSEAELNQALVDAKKELFNLHFQNATNQLDNTARIGEVKKNIARIKTVLSAKQKAEA